MESHSEIELNQNQGQAHNQTVEYEPEDKPGPLPSAPAETPRSLVNPRDSVTHDKLLTIASQFELDMSQFIANDLHATIEQLHTTGIPTVDQNMPPPEGYLIAHEVAPVPDILQAMIDERRDTHSTSIGGTIIPAHQVGFTMKGGKIEVLAPGRRRLWHPQRAFVEVNGENLVDINSEDIKVGNWHFVRVLPGQIGLALFNGAPHILEEGRHHLVAPQWKYIGKKNRTEFDIQWNECSALRIIRVRPGHMALLFENGAPKWLPSRTAPYELMSPLQEFAKMEDLMQDVIQMDNESTLDIVRVRPGCIGLAWQDSCPVILSQGLYELRAPRHQFVKLCSSMEEEIRLDNSNSLDIVRVLPGKVGLCWENSKPRLLKARTEPYILKKPAQQFVKLATLDLEHITLSSLHIITLKTGMRGVVWVNGTASIIEEGQHCFMEDNFIFGGSKDISTKHYQLGPYHYVTVDAGEVGVKHKQGHLEVLTAGTHVILTQQGETFHNFISVQQQVMLIESLAVRTSDNVDLKVDAVLTFKIKDPQKALADVKNLDELLKQRSFTTLSNIFAHINYSEKAVPVMPTGAVAGGPPPAYGDTYEMNTEVQHEFLKAIQQTSLQDWGVHITDLAVDNIKVVNEELADDLKQRALVTIQTENAQKNAEAKRRVDLLNAEKEVDQLKFAAQGKQVQAVAEAEAQAKAKIAVAEADAEAQDRRNEMEIAQAKAEAEAMMIRARAEADARKIMQEMEMEMSVKKAKAEAEALLLIAEATQKKIEAEAEAMKMLDENALKVRMWDAQVEMAKEMFRNQRTFVDTSTMPKMAEMLNLSALTGMGLVPGLSAPQNHDNK